MLRQLRFLSHRTKRKRILLMVLLAGLGILLMQRYAFSLLTPYKEVLRHKVQRLRKEGAKTGPDRQPSLDPENASSSTKVILLHNFPPWYELKSGPHYFASCNRSCTVTLDVELSEEVDSVVIFSHYMKSRVPPPSSPGQIWVYFAVESPFYSESGAIDNPSWQNRFNWTMTYRWDSEFYYGYGVLTRPSYTDSVPVRNFTSLVKNKTKMAAWFVSNCHTQSKREDFVSELQKFIDVDIYGKCGPLKCGVENTQICMDMLSKDYHFYLAFENSMCKDYITEKLYRTMKKVDIIPVVRGGANYSAILPKDSFIDVSQFPSVKALAEHLKKVAGDRELYERHLAWKNMFKVIEPMPFPLCDLCYRLHHPDSWAHVYPSAGDWWHQGACHDPPPVIKT